MSKQEHTGTFPSLNVPSLLFSDIKSLLRNVRTDIDSLRRSDVNVEFEVRLGTYEGTTFTPGVSYEEFSRFYTYLEENNRKLSSENSLDIYCKAVGKIHDKPLRITVNGSGAIMNYCNTNVLPLNTEDVSFQTKSRASRGSNIDIDIYDMRLSLGEESIYKLDDVLAANKIDSVEELNKRVYESEKQFRYKKRTSYLSSDKLFRFDLTQTKQIMTSNGLKYDKSLSESKIFDQSPVYEVEVELLYTDEFKANLKTIESRDFADDVVKHITKIMQIRQDTELVLSNNERDHIIKDFLSVHLEKRDVDREFDQYYNRTEKQYNKMFPGAKVSTLERFNVIKAQAQKDGKPYVFQDYAVTDKADGERFLLFVDSQGFVFLINDRMNILRTDVVVSSRERINSTILDGELVITYERGVKVYNYYAFDILYLDGRGVYRDPLFPKSERDRTSSRFYNLDQAVKGIVRGEIPKMNGVSIFTVHAKNFRTINDEDAAKMKQQCAFIWERREKGFPYELDGLIFTPKFEAYPIGKLWASALKWKPPEENSIDFLVKFQTGDNSIQSIVGTVDGREIISKYQLADLYVGDVSERQRGDQTIREYVEKRFDVPNTISKYPTYLIKIPLGSTGSKDDVVVRTDTIIECVWDSGWKVLRTRLDKTQRYLASGKKISNTANNIAVAVSIWTTIVYPITTEMITGASPIEEGEYYSKTGSTLTEPMRSFNNYIKSLLIGGARTNGGALIDFSCGRGGDIKKWHSSNYTRVVGLDYSKVGIESLDGRVGAIGRLEHLKKNSPGFSGWADSVKLFWADTSKITTATHPNGICQKAQKAAAKRALEIPFDVGASFFTAHYYFESPMKIRGFFQNLFDNLKDGGLALVTCFDGLEIFKWLDHLEVGQIYSGLVKSKPVWQVKKGYNKSTPFLDNSANVGLKIDIKFESISEDYYTEYLVHPKYFLKIAEEYGFSVIGDGEAQSMFGLKNGTALFGSLIEAMRELAELKKLRDSDVGRVFYRSIETFINDDDYADLREWTKHNRYFILRKHAPAGDLPAPKGWRSRLSKYDCENEYKEEVEPTTEAEVETPAVTATPKKRLTKKAAAAAVSEETVTVTPTVESASTVPETPAPKKRLTKKKASAETPASVGPESVGAPTQEPEPSVPESSVPEQVAEEQTPAPKKRILKKKGASPSAEAQSTPSEPSMVPPEPSVATPEASANTKTPKKQPKKKGLAVGPSVLEQLLKGMAEGEPAESGSVHVETPSELGCVVEKAVVGTKVKVPKSLLKKGKE
jgi:hypothetical protein